MKPVVVSSGANSAPRDSSPPVVSTSPVGAESIEPTQLFLDGFVEGSSSTVSARLGVTRDEREVYLQYQRLADGEERLSIHVSIPEGSGRPARKASRAVDELDVELRGLEERHRGGEDAPGASRTLRLEDAALAALTEAVFELENHRRGPLTRDETKALTTVVGRSELIERLVERPEVRALGIDTVERLVEHVIEKAEEAGENVP